MRNPIIKLTSKNKGERTDKVAARVRDIVSRALLEETVLMQDGKEYSVTVSDVRVSPDLRHAEIYAAPLGADIPPGFAEALNANAQEFNRIVAKELKTKYTPRLVFKADYGFENADKLRNVFHKIEHEGESGESGPDA